MIFFFVFNHNPFQLSLTKLSVTTDRHLTFDTIKRENMLIYEIKREKKIIVSWVKFSECALFTWWVALRLAYGSVSQDPTIAAAAAAAAALLQSPSDSVRPHRRQPTRLPVPGVLQARTLEWVAISYSDAWKWKVKVKSLSRVLLFATPWTAARQAPPSMGLSRQELKELFSRRASGTFIWSVLKHSTKVIGPHSKIH